MARKILNNAAALLLALACVMVQPWTAAQAQDGLTRITDSVYAYVGVLESTPGNRFCANVGVVIGDDAVLVVDTLTSAKEAELLLADIRKITDKPVRWVVNTHYHLDHSLGNCVFADQGARIIGQEQCRAALLASGETTLQSGEAFGLEPEYWEGTRIAAPDLTFDSAVEVDLGNMAVRIFYPGHPSHSAGSSMVLVPSQDVLFTGDILFTDFHPFLGEADLAGWAANLDEITAMAPGIIVPGHGPLSDLEDVAALKDYLVFFDANAIELSRTMSDPEQIVAEMLNRLPQLVGGEFIVPMNIYTRYMPSQAAQ